MPRISRLETLNKEEWNDAVTVVSSDMRDYEPEEKVSFSMSSRFFSCWSLLETDGAYALQGGAEARKESPACGTVMCQAVQDMGASTVSGRRCPNFCKKCKNRFVPRGTGPK